MFYQQPAYIEKQLSYKIHSLHAGNGRFGFGYVPVQFIESYPVTAYAITRLCCRDNRTDRYTPLFR